MLPVMVALSLSASLVECLFMLPGHLAHSGARGSTHGDRSRPQPPRRWLRHIRARFDRVVLAAIRRRYLTIGSFIAGFIAIPAYGALVMRFNLHPEVDIDTVNFKVELREGSSFDYRIQKCAELEALIRKRVNPEDLLNVTTRIGHHDTDLYGATEGRDPAWALLTLYMLPQGQRATNSNELEQQRVSLGNIGIAFAFCALSVFVVLVLLFNSLRKPGLSLPTELTRL